MKIISLSRIQSSSAERDFLKSVSRAFSKFGENRTFMVFQKFETDYNLPRDQIFENPELFSKTLRNIFRFGSAYIERAIVAELRADFALPEKDYHGLKDAVSEIRKSQVPA